VNGVSARLVWLVVACGATAAVFIGGAGARSAAAIKNATLPAVSGAAVEGSKLTTTRGTWSLSGSPLTKGAYAFNWLRCGPFGGHCHAIVGATTQSYVVGAGDIGSTIRSQVVVSLPPNLPGKASSNATAVVVKAAGAAAGTAPVNSAAPSVTGVAKVGQSLTADPGQWSGVQPITYAFQWQRCNAHGNGCGDIPGANGKTLSLDSSDLGKTLRVRVTARNKKGSATALSAATPVVAKAGGTPKPPSSVLNVNSLASTDRLVLGTTTFSPSVLTTRNPFTMRVEVTNSHGSPVSGALVYALPLPYGLVNPAPEVATDSTGFATLTLRPTSNLPIGKNGALVIFLRARRASDPLLGGISNRRLVQVSIR
jgi:hypothetical protein